MHDYDMLYFDMDGLLVNTEHLHFEAYTLMLQRRGFDFGVTFDEYADIALTSSGGLRKKILSIAPHLESEWNTLYEEKKRAYQELLESGKITLMPGVLEFLEATQDKRRCVVTNSTKEQVDVIRRALPELDQIPFWVTRELYKNPKPAPDGYAKAMELYGKPNDRTIGFEDSLRGAQSLIAAGITPILIAKHPYPELDVTHVTSFFKLL